MPFIHITAGVALDQQTKAALAGDVTQAISGILGKRREVTAVLIDSADPAVWFIDAQPIDAAKAVPVHTDVFITAGTNTEPEKAAMLTALHRALRHRLGPIPEVSYGIIHEIAGTDWGYAGITQEARRQARP